jgi:hypothetical protein
VKAARALSLDEFAAVTARLQAGVPRERVLEDAGLDGAEWESAQETWLARIAKLTARGNQALHRRFLERVAAHTAAELARPPAPAGPAPLPPAPAAAPLLGAAARARAARKEPPPAMPARPPVAAPPAMPARPPVAAPPPPPAASPSAAARRAVAVATASMEAVREQLAVAPFPVPPAGAPRRAAAGGDGALPFGAKARASTAAAPPPPKEAPPKKDFDPLAQTMLGDELPRGAPLPFVRGGKGDDGTLDEPSPEAVAALPFAGKPKPAPAARPRRDALPFRAVPEADKLTDTVDPEPAAQGQRQALPFKGGGGARPPSDRAAARAPGTDLPFRRAAPEPTLTLEQYAWLCAMIERAPERTVEALAQLRLGAGDKARVDAQFRAELERDPAKREAFERARQAYRRG